MNGELVGAQMTSLPGSSLPSRQPAHVAQLPKRSVRPVVARRAAKKQEQEEQPKKAGPFGMTSRIGVRKQKQSEPAQGTQKISSGKPKGNLFGRFGTQMSKGRKDANTVFVAGGSGRLGARIVRELLMKGFKVRVGVRDQAQGQSLLKTAVDFGLLTPEAGKKATVVEFDLLDEDTIGPAIGNAGKVVSAIGAAESQPFDVGAPKRIDGDAAIRLVNAAAASGVQEFVMVTALGTGKFGWPASLLNLFWGILIWKKRAEEALEASGMQYIIVRPGGMEVPRDDHKLTHNVILGSRDSTFGGTVSRLQVAELIATSLTSPGLGANKVLEVWSETSAPELDYESLLRQQPNEKSSDEENEAAAREAAPAPSKPAAAPKPAPKQRPQAAQPKRAAAKFEPQVAQAAAEPESPPEPRAKNPAELQRDEERAQELERQKQWQAQQEEQRLASQVNIPEAKPRDLEAEAQEQRERAAKKEEYAKSRAEMEARVTAEAEEEKRKEREQITARREADKRKKLEAADKEAAVARKQAEEEMLAQNNVTKVITPPGTQLSEPEQDLASAQPSKKLPGAETGKKEAQPAPPKGSNGASPSQAKKNAEDAAEWIGNWRENVSATNGASGNGASASNGASPSAGSNGAAASQNGAESNGSKKLENAQEARGWIQNWRSRQ